MSQRFNALPPDRKSHLRTLLQARLDAVAAQGPTPRRDAGPAPLSAEQEALWSHIRSAPDPRAFTVWHSMRMRGALDVAALRSALASVVKRHDALRTAIVPRQGVPVQDIRTEVPAELTCLPAPGESHPERLAAARAVMADCLSEPFRLEYAPLWRVRLIRIEPDDHLFAVQAHQIICDTGSLDRILTELAEVYRAIGAEHAPALADPAFQYPDYAVWQHAPQRTSAGADGGSAQARDTSDTEFLEFPADRPRGKARTRREALGRFAIDRQLLRRVRALARHSGAELEDVCKAAFLAFLHRYTGSEDLAIGCRQPHGPHRACEPVIGLFETIARLRVSVSGDASFRELLLRVTHSSPDHMPAPEVQVVFGAGTNRPGPALPGLETVQEDVRPGAARFEMAWTIAEQTGAGEPRLEITYDTGLFDEESVARFARHYFNILDALVADPDARLSAAEMLGQADRDFLSEIGCGPRRPIRDTTLVAEFEARVAEAPDAVALVVEKEETSYGVLNARANQLAALLSEHGVGRGKRVGLSLRRTADLPMAVLAVLKAGAAYVPLDPAHPASRVAEIAADADLSLIIAHLETSEPLRGVSSPVVVLDECRAALADLPSGNRPLAAEPDDVAYIIFTSGSTGRPKGVLLGHRGVVNFIETTQQLFDLSPADRVLAFASITFDVSVFETFAALLTGARLYVATDAERLSIDRLQALMAESGISVIDLPPTVMPLLDPEAFEDLRIAFVGGEAFGPELVNRWNPGRRLFNGYGPTECTVTMIVEECAGMWDSTPPIGLPMTNHVAHVLDRHLGQVPIGVPGELVIGGAGLAQGYLNREELTAEKFIPDPFGTAPGGRLYRTGDLVKRLPDGRLVFVGRLDQQVKIRGLRIELGEIESALAEVDGVEQVSVRTWTDAAGGKHLVGYVTGIPEQEAGTLRDHLGAMLPSYMIPSYFLVLDEMPLTSSGKVDWRKLPAPNPGAARDVPKDAPRTATERILLTEILGPLLRNDGLGVHDDFFQVGGNSLQAAQTISAINKRFGIEIPLSDFFLAPAAAQLADIIDRGRSGARTARADPETAAAPVQMRAPEPAQLVLIHPSGGELFCYVPLVRALKSGFGVAGFAADPADAALNPETALSAVAGRIAMSLSAAPQSVPPCIAGWSYGGVLAFEIARQLEAGLGVQPHVVLIDADFDEDDTALTESEIKRRFFYDVARLAGKSTASVLENLDDPGLASATVKERLAALDVQLSLNDTELAHRFNTYRACALSMEAYQPPHPYGGPVSLLAVAPRDAVEARWRAVCTGTFRGADLPGDHYTVFSEPALGLVVDEIERSLHSTGGVDALRVH